MSNLVETIENKMEEFGLENINESTTVFVNKEDLTDVSVDNTEFNTFTKAHTAPARWFVDFDDVDETYSINTEAIERFVNDEVE